ncbi:Rib/alpha-like domain-containing protein [Corynebacterium hadale]|uniref:Rib/alpha-like domain-containing protein n=1 Tax=Corynebacterium hadale TaxID=2026255 RepID=UPI0013FE3649|nr:Rib/alpha-like domain-containing protein [Corynebacterium hadale]
MTIDDAEFFVRDFDDPDTGVNNRDWVRIEKSKTGEFEIVARPNGNEKLINDDPHQIPIQIKFPDGSVSPAFDIPVTVTKAGKVDLSGLEKSVNPTNEPQKTGIKVNDQISSKDITATWADKEGNTGTIGSDKFTIDGGEVFITPGTDAKGEITVKIDNTTMKEPVKPKLHVNTQADRYTPEANGEKQTVTVGTTLDQPLAEKIVTNIDDLPSGTTADFKPEDGKAPVATVEGDKKVTIVVTYPDGTADEITTTVGVIEAGKVDLSGLEKSVNPTNEPQKTGIKVNDQISSKDITATWADKEGNTGTIGSDKFTIDGGEVFITPGTDAKGEITVKIDNTTMKEPVKPKLHVNTQADRYTPEANGEKQTVTVGTTLDQPLAEKIVTNIDDLPSGTTADFKPEDGKAPVATVEGDKKVTIVVTYPDGTSEEIQTDLTVERRTDAEKNEPTVDENFEIIAGSKLRQEHAEKIVENIGSLPSGTTADFKDKGEGSLSTENPTPNDIDKDVTIVVTYPDGSTEEIDTKITIKPRPDNWDFQPQVREKVITAGDKLEARDVIENLHDLPQDIEVELDGDVDTSTPGSYNPQVVVTYPDGSQDRVGSTIVVNPKPLTNKQFDPNYGDTVKLTPGESKSAENPFGDETAPEGTKYEAKFRSDATDWTFDEDKANETGVVTAQAPSARDLAQEFARVTKYTHLDWDTLAAVLKPMVTTSVEVDIDYADGSFDAATAAFELVDADGHSLLDPEADADGDGHTNREEVEKRSNPFDEESVPEPPADWNTSNANTVYPGENVTVPNNGGRVQVGTTVKVDGPGTAEINKDGDLVITANEDAKPGDKIVATMTDADGNQIDIVQVSVKEDERLQGDKTNATFGRDPYVLIPGETKDTNRPFGPFGIPDDTEITVQVPADATDWKFEGNEDGTVTAQAPSAAQLAAQFSALDKATQKDWDKLAEALAPVVAPTVGVNFTFTDGSNDFANARFELTDANDKSILDPDADFDGDGRTNKQEVDTGTNPFERNYFEPHWDATEGEGSAEPGGKLTIPNKGGKIPKGAIVDVAGPGSAVIDDRGNLVVAVEEQAIPGDEITATVKDEQGAEIQRIVIIVNAKVNSNTHTEVGEPGKDTSLSSNIDQGKCSAAAIGFGLPLLAIVPLAIASQAAIPGLAGFREQVAVQIEQVNSQIQNGLGIMNPQIAKQVSDINGQLRQYGTNVATIGGGLLLFAAGIGVTALIVDSCKPGGPTSSN